MAGHVQLFLYHMSGTLMIESGVDRSSRGDKSVGGARGSSVLNFVHIHLSPSV